MADTDYSRTTERSASRIIAAVQMLRIAFLDAGLKEPIALVVAGHEQKRLLEYTFQQEFGHMMRQNTERPWEGTTLAGIKVLHDVPA